MELAGTERQGRAGRRGLMSREATQSSAWSMHFLGRRSLPKVPRKNCANARSGTAPGTCWRQPGSSVQARLIWKRGRRFPIPIFEKSSVHCQAWARRSRIVSCFLPTNVGALPIDVWIERVLRQQYFPRNKTISPEQLRTFSETYFGEHGGYAQQYLFHHARMIKNAKARAPRAAAAKK